MNSPADKLLLLLVIKMVITAHNEAAKAIQRRGRARALAADGPAGWLAGCPLIFIQRHKLSSLLAIDEQTGCDSQAPEAVEVHVNPGPASAMAALITATNPGVNPEDAIPGPGDSSP